MNSSLIFLFQRDLDRLKSEVKSFNSNEVFWKVDKEISNSSGNLTIHIIGNLNHFIGATLGKSGYVRDRDGEFNNKNIPRKQILEDIENVKIIITNVISNLDKEDLVKIYPINIRKEGMSIEQFLMHLYGHLNYHLGQINYHRRLIN